MSKFRFIFKILQTNFCPLQRTPPPNLYTAAREFSIVQSSVAGHQLTHPIQQVCHFRFHLLDTLKMSSFQHTFQFGEQVKVTGG
jgi:hypothetical protein